MTAPMRGTFSVATKTWNHGRKTVQDRSPDQEFGDPATSLHRIERTLESSCGLVSALTRQR